MPGKINLNFDISVSNGKLSVGPNYVRQEIVQTNVGGPSPGTVVVTTGGVDITHTLTNLGVCRITNLDDTNFVLVGPKVSGTQHDFLKIKPGESYPMRLKPGIAVSAKADTASCRVNFEFFED